MQRQPCLFPCRLQQIRVVDISPLFPGGISIYFHIPATGHINTLINQESEV